MMTRSSRWRLPGNRAFAYIDFLFVTAGVFILLLAFSAAANNRRRSEYLVCFNNLRQIGIGMQIWAGSHGDEKPWRVPAADGGSSGHRLAENAWFHFTLTSNELRSPTILACPSDVLTRTANDWTSRSTGFVNPQM